jgi:hypothetical protein
LAVAAHQYRRTRRRTRRLGDHACKFEVFKAVDESISANNMVFVWSKTTKKQKKLTVYGSIIEKYAHIALVGLQKHTNATHPRAAGYHTRAHGA